MKKWLMQDSQKTARSGPHPVQRTTATEDEKGADGKCRRPLNCASVA